jgi:membrane-bound lytic murein transglycosylase B
MMRLLPSAIYAALIFICLPDVSLAESAPKPDWNFVESQLTKNKFSKTFVAELHKTYEERDFDEVLRLNVLLFLRKSDYHGPQVTEQAQQEVGAFIEANKKTLALAEKTYSVPGPVIASLLFIESRHGKNLGDFHVPSVFLHMIQAPRKDVQIFLQTQTDRFAETVTAKQREEIRSRTHRKALWAIGELHALEKAYKWKWKLGKEFRGSFSGAFGMPQFLPTSYVRWARALDPAEQPNLDGADDAILSVGRYLHGHGWKSQSAKAKMKALMKYNNSVDYAKAILALAAGSEQRSTASQKSASPR